MLECSHIDSIQETHGGMNVSMENYQTLISRDVTYEKKKNKQEGYTW